MKNFKLVVLFVLGLNLVTLSCSSDDDNNNDSGAPVQGQMTIDGTSYNIVSGFLQDYGSNENGSFDWDIFLVSEGLNVDFEQEGYSGTGSLLYLDLNTNSESGLVPGTYEFSDIRDEFTWVDAGGIKDFNSETESGTPFQAVSGTIVITGSGANQTIVVTLEDENGNPLTASYTGELEVI